jgi:hypothetical protein
VGNLFGDLIIFASNIGKVAFNGLGNIGISGSGQPVVLLVIFGAFVLAVVGFWLGRSRILISILSVFAGYFIESNFNLFSKIGKSSVPVYMINLGVFMLAFLISFFIMSRSVLKSRITVKDASFVSIIILSIINAGFFASVIISYFPISSGLIPTQLALILGTKTARLAWAAVALIAMFVLKGKREVSPSISKK